MAPHSRSGADLRGLTGVSLLARRQPTQHVNLGIPDAPGAGRLEEARSLATGAVCFEGHEMDVEDFGRLLCGDRSVLRRVAEQLAEVGKARISHVGLHQLVTGVSQSRRRVPQPQNTKCSGWLR